jgi:hypothetical protein
MNDGTDTPSSDAEALRRHIELQARYRESLGQPPGPPTNPASKLESVPHCLPRSYEGVAASTHGLNLMSPAAREYAHARLAALKRIGGVAFADRVWRNLLSSQPLAFSVVGELRQHQRAAAAVFAELTGREVVALETLSAAGHEHHALDQIDAEWFPPRQAHTDDGSGFDIAALLRLGDGTRLLLTVEVKYVDTFSRKPLDIDRYAWHLDAVGLTRDAAGALVARGCSQFLRSVLLTDSVRRGGLGGLPGDGPQIEHALAVVLAREDDQTATTVVNDVSGNHLPTVSSLWTHRQFFTAAQQQPELSGWAKQMSDRYLLPSG